MGHLRRLFVLAALGMAQGSDFGLHGSGSIASSTEDAFVSSLTTKYDLTVLESSDLYISASTHLPLIKRKRSTTKVASGNVTSVRRTSLLAPSPPSPFRPSLGEITTSSVLRITTSQPTGSTSAMSTKRSNQPNASVNPHTLASTSLASTMHQTPPFVASSLVSSVTGSGTRDARSTSLSPTNPQLSRPGNSSLPLTAITVVSSSNSTLGLSTSGQHPTSSRSTLLAPPTNATAIVSSRSHSLVHSSSLSSGSTVSLSSLSSTDLNRKTSTTSSWAPTTATVPMIPSSVEPSFSHTVSQRSSQGSSTTASSLRPSSSALLSKSSHVTSLSATPQGPSSPSFASSLAASITRTISQEPSNISPTPGNGVPTKSALPTTAGHSTSSASLSTSTNAAPTVALDAELDRDADHLDHLVGLIGVWLKKPIPNPKDIILLIDTVLPALDALKPKLPQPSPNDPQCRILAQGNPGIIKRFPLFDILGGTVKNAVEAVARTGLTITRLRTQLAKGAIELVEPDLADLVTLTEALKKYDLASDPCKLSAGLPSKSLPTRSTMSRDTSMTSTTSYQSTCSARTISDCKVVCTSTTTAGGGSKFKRAVSDCSTSCGPPVITCASATTSTSTVISTVMPNFQCNKKGDCCGKRDENFKARKLSQNSVFGPVSLGKRRLPNPYGPPYNGVFNFIRDICNARETITVDTGERQAVNTILYTKNWDNQPKNICMASLIGCSALLVMNHRFFWMAHFWEQETVANPSTWRRDVWDAIQYGNHGSNIQPILSLGALGQPGQVFGPGSDTRVVIVGPYVRRTHPNAPSPTQLLYPNWVDQLESFVQRLLPLRPGVITRAPYAADDSVIWGFTHKPREQHPFLDVDYPWETPFGSILINYDNNKWDASPRCATVAGYNIWVADGANPVSSDQWWALPHQIPDHWQKREETLAPVCSLISTFSTKISSVSKSSHSGSTTKMSPTGGSTVKGSTVKGSTTVRASTAANSKTSLGSTSQSSSQASSPVSSPKVPSTIATSRTSKTISATSTSIAPPKISVSPCGDEDCDCCGSWQSSCESSWCSSQHLTGNACTDACFGQACWAPSSPTECRPGGRCHRPACPNKPDSPPKSVRDGGPLTVASCKSSNDCDCCIDYANQCFTQWIPDDIADAPDKSPAYVWCFSEACFNGPPQCRKHAVNGCEFMSRSCPDKKGQAPKNGNGKANMKVLEKVFQGTLRL